MKKNKKSTLKATIVYDKNTAKSFSKTEYYEAQEKKLWNKKKNFEIFGF